ncbi:MAG: electron transport complex subunit RsxC, partial [Pseudomonadota bacterium]|nr:electron transport complex subunit RsxC [Pseudomonadota bacterium]
GVDKITQKIEAAEKELAELEPAEFTPPSSEVMDAAGDAIARAMAKAKANAEMSPQQKLEAQVESLQQRLAKAQKRLQKAEADQDENIAAFANAVTKTREKLEQAQAELEAL